MHGDEHGSGEDPRERLALRLIRDCAETEDGTGRALEPLEELVRDLEPDVLRLPSVRVALEPLMAEIRLGLGDDAAVADTLTGASVDALLGDTAARVVALRVARALVRVEAVELRPVVKRLEEGSGADAILATGLELAGAALDAVSPGAHPLAYPRLPGRFADRVLGAGDTELLLLFADVENGVHAHALEDQRLAADLMAAAGRESGDGDAPDCPEGDDFGNPGGAV